MRQPQRVELSCKQPTPFGNAPTQDVVRTHDNRQLPMQRGRQIAYPGTASGCGLTLAWAWLNTHLGMQGTLWFSLTLGVIIAFIAITLAKQARVFRPFFGQPSGSA